MDHPTNKVEQHARAIQQSRIAAAIEDARDYVDDIRLAQHVIAAGRPVTQRQRDFIIGAAAMLDDDMLWNALVAARIKVVAERNADIDVTLNRGFR